MTELPDINQLLALTKDMLLVSLAISGACAVICGLIAARRQARVAYWSVMGFVFGPFAIPFVFRAKPRTPPAETEVKP